MHCSIKKNIKNVKTFLRQFSTLIKVLSSLFLVDCSNNSILSVVIDSWFSCYDFSCLHSISRS